MTSPVNVDVKLGVNKFNVDEEHPHIVVKADADKQALELLSALEQWEYPRGTFGVEFRYG